MTRFTDLPYDVLELMIFRLRLLSAADVAALRMASPGLAKLLGSKFDLVRHRALGGLRACLDWSFPDAALWAIERLGADPSMLKWRALRLAIRTDHRRLFALVFERALDAHMAWLRRIDPLTEDEIDETDEAEPVVEHALSQTLVYAVRAGAVWAVVTLVQSAPIPTWSIRSAATRAPEGSPVQAAMSALLLEYARGSGGRRQSMMGRDGPASMFVSCPGLVAACSPAQLADLEGIARTRWSRRFPVLLFNYYSAAARWLLRADDADPGAAAAADWLRTVCRRPPNAPSVDIQGLIATTLCLSDRRRLARALLGTDRRLAALEADLPGAFATHHSLGGPSDLLLRALERWPPEFQAECITASLAQAARRNLAPNSPKGRTWTTKLVLRWGLNQGCLSLPVVTALGLGPEATTAIHRLAAEYAEVPGGKTRPLAFLRLLIPEAEYDKWNWRVLLGSALPVCSSMNDLRRCQIFMEIMHWACCIRSRPRLDTPGLGVVLGLAGAGLDVLAGFASAGACTGCLDYTDVAAGAEAYSRMVAELRAGANPEELGPKLLSDVLGECRAEDAMAASQTAQFIVACREDELETPALAAGVIRAVCSLPGPAPAITGQAATAWYITQLGDRRPDFRPLPTIADHTIARYITQLGDRRPDFRLLPGLLADYGAGASQEKLGLWAAGPAVPHIIAGRRPLVPIEKVQVDDANKQIGKDWITPRGAEYIISGTYPELAGASADEWGA